MRDKLIRKAVEKEVQRMLLSVETMDNGLESHLIKKSLNGVLETLEEIRQSTYKRFNRREVQQ